MGAPFLEARDLWKSYDGRVQVLHGAQIALHPGTGTIIWGRNGSGKTTLLNLLSCLDLPDRGEIWFDGEEVTRLSARRRAWFRRHRIGFVFQDHNLLEELTVRQNVLLPLKLARASGADSRADALMEQFHLANLSERRPRQISLGESQRVAIVRALANEAPLLVADEPTASLDEDVAPDLLALFDSLRQEGKTILMASHDPLAKALQWRRLRIEGGKLAPTQNEEADA